MQTTCFLQVLEECEDVSAVVSGGVMEGQEGEDADLQAELDQLLDTEPHHHMAEEMEQDGEFSFSY